MYEESNYSNIQSQNFKLDVYEITHNSKMYVSNGIRHYNPNTYI